MKRESKVSQYRRGYYIPENKGKLLGTRTPIYRSSYELTFMKFLDKCESVVKWGSECIKIPYWDTRLHHERSYFMDFLVIDNTNQCYLLEIKPKRAVKRPSKTKEKSKHTLLYEQITWINNMDKWKATVEFCKQRKWIFKIKTEDDIFSSRISYK